MPKNTPSPGEDPKNTLPPGEDNNTPPLGEEQKETPPAKQDFENKKDIGIVHEFFVFLWENKLWWMIPIALILSLLIALITISANSGAAAPFIYTLF